MIIKDFLNNIDQLSQEYELTREQTLKACEKGLISGCKKSFQVKSCRVCFQKDYDQILLYKQYLVISEQRKEIINYKEHSCMLLEEARKIDKNVQIGDILEIEVDPQNFNLHASKDFKNKFHEELIKQKRENIYNFFKNKENHLISAEIFDEKDNFFVLSLEKDLHTFLSKKEILYNDNFSLGEKILVLVTKVQNTTKMPKVFVSRKNVHFVIALFKEFIPEVQEGIIKIMGIARIPSDRVKVGLMTTDVKIDPIGACIGEKGIRIQNIINVLKGEKIDLFQWSLVPEELITNALQPAKIIKVTDINTKHRTVSVIVEDNQVSLAIGKLGQNVKLAVQVTKWNINIRTVKQYEQEY
ncbi:transcription termination factor NusA [Candidatus Phytoplasma melaleucae]|uniref:Transcription termination/antitermination protein NusA n=1 Tax=Candidatus Phytoplasma melaleucae TaxID=2982630 RepID=A0ABT9DEG4_9MOLU|nr:transcription termination factor NusA ['Melaleuca sp.' phytoplasma]MDO8167961.1 transcription termination factor NusA ['Melaleuca sp.' phytoplasma]